jgi:hypothetical protein
MQTQELLSFHIVKRLNPHNLQKDNVFYSIVFNVFVAKKNRSLKLNPKLKCIDMEEKIAIIQREIVPLSSLFVCRNSLAMIVLLL